MEDGARPLISEWMRGQIGPRGVANTLKEEVPRWGEMLPQLPSLAHEVLRQAKSGQFQLKMESDELAGIRSELRRTTQRMVLAVTGAALLASVAIPLVGGHSPSWLMAALGVLGIGLLGYAFLGEES